MINVTKKFRDKKGFKLQREKYQNKPLKFAAP